MAQGTIILANNTVLADQMEDYLRTYTVSQVEPAYLEWKLQYDKNKATHGPLAYDLSHHDPADAGGFLVGEADPAASPGNIQVRPRYWGGGEARYPWGPIKFLGGAVYTNVMATGIPNPAEEVVINWWSHHTPVRIESKNLLDYMTDGIKVFYSWKKPTAQGIEGEDDWGMFIGTGVNHYGGEQTHGIAQDGTPLDYIHSVKQWVNFLFGNETAPVPRQGIFKGTLTLSDELGEGETPFIPDVIMIEGENSYGGFTYKTEALYQDFSEDVDSCDFNPFTLNNEQNTNFTVITSFHYFVQEFNEAINKKVEFDTTSQIIEAHTLGENAMPDANMFQAVKENNIGPEAINKSTFEWKHSSQLNMISGDPWVWTSTAVEEDAAAPDDDPTGEVVIAGGNGSLSMYMRNWGTNASVPTTSRELHNSLHMPYFNVGIYSSAMKSTGVFKKALEDQYVIQDLAAQIAPGTSLWPQTSKIVFYPPIHPTSNDADECADEPESQAEPPLFGDPGAWAAVPGPLGGHSDEAESAISWGSYSAASMNKSHAFAELIKSLGMTRAFLQYFMLASAPDHRYSIDEDGDGFAETVLQLNDVGYNLMDFKVQENNKPVNAVSVHEYEGLGNVLAGERRAWDLQEMLLFWAWTVELGGQFTSYAEAGITTVQKEIPYWPSEELAEYQKKLSIGDSSAVNPYPDIDPDDEATWPVKTIDALEVNPDVSAADAAAEAEAFLEGLFGEDIPVLNQTTLLFSEYFFGTPDDFKSDSIAAANSDMDAHPCETAGMCPDSQEVRLWSTSWVQNYQPFARIVLNEMSSFLNERSHELCIGGLYQNMIASPGPAPRETVLYRVEKLQVKFDTNAVGAQEPTYRPIQNRYFLNTCDLNMMEYLDTQIKPAIQGDMADDEFHAYVWRVYAYDLVYATKYKYHMIDVDPNRLLSAYYKNDPAEFAALAGPVGTYWPEYSATDFFLTDGLSWLASEEELDMWQDVKEEGLNAIVGKVHNQLAPGAIWVMSDVSLDDLINASTYVRENWEPGDIWPGWMSRYYANFEVITTPDLKIVQQIIYQTDPVILMSKPPVPPDIIILPWQNISDSIMIKISAAQGSRKELPVAVGPGDVDRIIKQYIAQGMSLEKANIERQFHLENGRFKTKMLFENDEHQSKFELFEISGVDMTNTGIRYDDFGAGSVYDNETNVFFVQKNIKPNQKYYFAARNHDPMGNISNPSPIFEFEMVMLGSGLIIPIFKEYQQPPADGLSTKTMKQYINIKPSLSQMTPVDQSVFTEDDMSINFADSDTFLNKKFKLRLTSKQTGRKIDVNFKFRVKDKGDIMEQNEYVDTSELFSFAGLLEGVDEE